ncbi:hypothetical protein [Winogradskyella endarachnes]|uniref:Uncharacterized protein n=1 Tax=Winogradskyella endarachnes TaxID=2681965 RepID=A0A6L6UFR2_9FLAO|nr:hypothetical protein [Winogradskyella endarachnes]MUU79694.1 hypothetical protein [Winogradskyella endarachnes]
MKTTQTQSNYTEWISAEQMHQDSKEWLSELLFIKDEHLFYEDLIKTFTMQLIEPEHFVDNKEIIDTLNRSQKQNNLLIEAIKVHENDLQILLDGINQTEQEKAYRKSHKGLILELIEFEKFYKILKKQVFDIFSAIKKEDKLNHLLEQR